MLEQQIQQHFIDSADLKYQAAQALSKPIAEAVQAILACVTSGGKVLAWSAHHPASGVAWPCSRLTVRTDVGRSPRTRPSRRHRTGRGLRVSVDVDERQPLG